MRLPLPATLAVIFLNAVSGMANATAGAIVEKHAVPRRRRPKAPAWLSEAREVREP